MLTSALGKRGPEGITSRVRKGVGKGSFYWIIAFTWRFLPQIQGSQLFGRSHSHLPSPPQTTNAPVLNQKCTDPKRERPSSSPLRNEQNLPHLRFLGVGSQNHMHYFPECCFWIYLTQSHLGSPSGRRANWPGPPSLHFWCFLWLLPKF